MLLRSREDFWNRHIVQYFSVEFLVSGLLWRFRGSFSRFPARSSLLLPENRTENRTRRSRTRPLTFSRKTPNGSAVDPGRADADFLVIALQTPSTRHFETLSVHSEHSRLGRDPPFIGFAGRQDTILILASHHDRPSRPQDLSSESPSFVQSSEKNSERGPSTICPRLTPLGRSAALDALPRPTRSLLFTQSRRRRKDRKPSLPHPCPTLSAASCRIVSQPDRQAQTRATAKPAHAISTHDGSSVNTTISSVTLKI